MIIWDVTARQAKLEISCRLQLGEANVYKVTCLLTLCVTRSTLKVPLVVCFQQQGPRRTADPRAFTPRRPAALAQPAGKQADCGSAQ